MRLCKKPTVMLHNGKFFTMNMKEIDYVDDKANHVEDIGKADCKVFKNDFEALCVILKANNDDIKYNCSNLLSHCLYNLMFDTRGIVPISQEEFNWINQNTYHDQVRYVDTQARIKRDEIKQYDVNSMFPYAMSSGMDVPISKLQFGNISTLDDIKYKVYFVRVTYDTLPKYLYQGYDSKTTKWFSAYDLRTFKAEGCKYELVCDGEDNIAYYKETQRIKHQCILRLFETKKTNVVAKMIIKKLHGIAIERKRVNIDNIEKGAEMKASCILKRTYECRHPLFYRLKTVLYHTVKYIMGVHARKLVADNCRIYRIATDSITFDSLSSVLDGKLNDKMGSFKVESKITDDRIYSYTNTLELKPVS